MICLDFHGGLGGIRTRDQRIKSPLLYRLSYQPVKEYNYGLFRHLCQYYCVKYFISPVIFLPQIDLFKRSKESKKNLPTPKLLKMNIKYKNKLRSSKYLAITNSDAVNSVHRVVYLKSCGLYETLWFI